MQQNKNTNSNNIEYVPTMFRSDNLDNANAHNLIFTEHTVLFVVQFNSNVGRHIWDFTE